MGVSACLSSFLTLKLSGNHQNSTFLFWVEIDLVNDGDEDGQGHEVILRTSCKPLD